MFLSIIVLLFVLFAIITLSISKVASSLIVKTRSFLADIPIGTPDAILQIVEKFKRCKDPRKVNICIGAYRDEIGSPVILSSVTEAEKMMMKDPSRNKEYSGVIGDPEFIALAIKFAYGQYFDQTNIAAIQTLSGTGACRLGGQFLANFAPVKKILVPDPTWGNHFDIFQACGLEVSQYRYYNRSSNNLDFDGMVTDIQNASCGTIVLLHVCAHNPTGIDPSIEQWKKISSLCKERNLQVLFDCAYQGFASGNPEADAFALRYFASQGHSIVVAQSFSKNFGLYGERCGTLSIMTADIDQKEKVLSQLKCMIRPMYSTPPIHGASIVKTILSNSDLTNQHQRECKMMANRIILMRKILVEMLNETGSTLDWTHISRQCGMFAFSGMSRQMCERLTAEFAIFLTLDGRISLAGLNNDNVEYVAKAIHEVTK